MNAVIGSMSSIRTGEPSGLPLDVDPADEDDCRSDGDHDDDYDD
jgi:hypothetical protein